MALACADLHLRDVVPVCRTETDIGFQFHQIRKLKRLFEQARLWDVPVLIAGDTFDHWKPSHKLVAEVIETSKGARVIAVPGQHDLYAHDVCSLPKTGLGVLRASDWVILTKGESFILPSSKIKITGYAFGEEPGNSKDTDILLWHMMTFVGKPPYPECPDSPAPRLAKRFPNVKLMITGDNHQPFYFNQTDQSRILNCGSMMRMTADQMDYKPMFYAIHDNLNCTPIPFPIERNVVSNVHLVREQEHDAKLEAFISRITKDSETSLSFEANMDRFLEIDKTPAPVRQAVMMAMEKEN